MLGNSELILLFDCWSEWPSDDMCLTLQWLINEAGGSATHCDTFGGTTRKLSQPLKAH